MKGKGIGKAILRAGIILSAYATIAVCAWLAFRALGIDARSLSAMRDRLGGKLWFWAAVAGIQSLQVVFIPISNQIVTIPLCLAFPNELWKAFLSSWIGIEAGTIALYFLGKYGGKKAVGWILSDAEKAQRCADFLKRGKAFYPLGMVIGLIPDDILTTLAGMSGFGFPYVLLVSLLARGVCTAATVWGWGWLARRWWGWIILCAAGALLVVATVLIWRKTNKKAPKEAQGGKGETNQGEGEGHPLS